MKLSNEVRTHVIVFKDNSKKWITDHDYQGLLKSDHDSKVKIDGQIYDFVMISKILTRDEYYREYPENRPAVYNNQILNDPPINIKLDHKKKRELILGGIEKAVGKNDFYRFVKRNIEKKERLIPSELMKK